MRAKKSHHMLGVLPVVVRVVIVRGIGVEPFELFGVTVDVNANGNRNDERHQRRFGEPKKQQQNCKYQEHGVSSHVRGKEKIR